MIAGNSLYSQNNEELIIRSFFQDKLNGIFLDVGCACPKKNSNTYFLEKHLAWSGVAVDAKPRNIEGWKSLRSNTKLFSFIITDHYGTKERFYEAGWVGSVEKVRVMPTKTIRGKEIIVPTMTLSKLLDDQDISNLDFVSIDIENSEEKALAGFDINRFQPSLVCIERTRKNKQAISNYFEAHQYQLIEEYLAYDQLNLYFTPKS